jgi:hypothetical protein
MNNGGEIYTSVVSSQVKRFAVEEDLSMNLVAHQLTAQRKEMEGIKTRVKIIGGVILQMLITLYVQDRALDFKDPDVIFGSQRLKQKLVGIPQDVNEITLT